MEQIVGSYLLSTHSHCPLLYNPSTTSSSFQNTHTHTRSHKATIVTTNAATGTTAGVNYNTVTPIIVEPLSVVMDIESVKCVCCGLREECTQEYIDGVKANFDGKWLCGLCSEAVREEVSRGRRKGCGMEEAVGAHMDFCGKFRSNPAVRVADGMRQMLRKRSEVMPGSAAGSKKFGRSVTMPLR